MYKMRSGESDINGTLVKPLAIERKMGACWPQRQYDVTPLARPSVVPSSIVTSVEGLRFTLTSAHTLPSVTQISAWNFAVSR